MRRGRRQAFLMRRCSESVRAFGARARVLAVDVVLLAVPIGAA